MKPLVLLHGFTGSPRAWDAVCEALPEGVTVLRPPLFGHGADAGSVASFEDEVDRLVEVVRDASIRGAHLVGYSLGGRLALGLIVRHPQLFASATCIGVHPGLAEPAEREERARSDEALASVLEREGLDPFLAEWERLPLFATQSRLPSEVLERQRRERRRHDAQGLARALRILGLARMPNFRPALSSLSIPITLAVGELDSKFRALATEMLGALRCGRLLLVPGAGHNLVLERPDALAVHLREVLGSEVSR